MTPNKFLAAGPASLISLILVFLISGCQSSAPDKTTIEQPGDEEQAIVVPDADLTGAMLADILSAEIAARQGRYEFAINEVLKAARSSSDPRLAAKAAYWGLQNGLYLQARIASELWIELLAGQPAEALSPARFALAGSLVAAGDRAQAKQVYHQIIRESQDEEVFKRISAQLSSMPNLEGLTDFYTSLIARTTATDDAYVGLALLASRLGDTGLSKQAAATALEANPGDEDAALITLSYLFDTNDLEAITAFADPFLKRNPGANRLRIEYARYLSGTGETENAIKQFEKVLAHDESTYDEVTLNIVGLAMQAQDFRLADKNLAAMLERTPTDDRLIYFRCQVQRELKNYPLATELCSEIVHGEYYFLAQLELGGIMADAGQIQSAISQLETIPVSGQDEQIRVYLSQQQILHNAQQLEQAVTLLNNALDQYMDDPSLLYARGLIFSELGWVDAHERDMRKLIRLDPENAHAYNALGYTLADMTTRYNEALELISKAAQLRPDDAYILDSLGWVYFKLNELDKARVNLEQAFDLSGDAEIAAHLGELYWEMGDKDRARSIWLKAREQTPDNKVLNNTLERFL